MQLTIRRNEEGSGALPTDLYDASTPERPTRVVSRREFAVRRRAMELLRQDPNRFFSMVRDCDQRESAGTEPIAALEQALDAVGNEYCRKIEG
jgi:hypothetical protein